MLKKLVKQARQNPKAIIFPEGNDERILKAVKLAIKNKIAFPLLMGNKKKIISALGKPKKYGIVDTKMHEKYLAEKLHSARKNKFSRKQAGKLIKNDAYFAVMYVKEGLADGLVGGVTLPTKDILIPAFQLIKTRRNRRASGAFLMITKDKKEYIFADCAANINPDSKTLADIAEESIETARFLGMKPKVAMLSFSTHGSARSEETGKVRQAVKMMKKKYPKVPIDGEIQLDAAIVPEISKRKCKKCRIKGDANILIFPTLDAGNIGYKLVERFANAHAIGPIIQGLKKPINELSRGASVQDIYHLTALTVVQAQRVKK